MHVWTRSSYVLDGNVPCGKCRRLTVVSVHAGFEKKWTV
jgi:hypothetical protein